VISLLHHHENEHQWSVNNFKSIKSGNQKVIWLWLGIMNVMAVFKGKEKATQSLPHSENECQRSVNDFRLCILGYLSGDWLQTSINEVLTAFSGKNNRGTLPAPS